MNQQFVNSDCLVVNGLKQKVCIGCTEKERDWPQLLQFDLRLYCDFTKSAASEHLEDTVDYMAAISLVSELCKTKKWKLLETLASELSETFFSHFKLVTKVEINIHKRVSELCESVTASLVRERPL